MILLLYFSLLFEQGMNGSSLMKIYSETFLNPLHFKYKIQISCNPPQKSNNIPPPLPLIPLPQPITLRIYLLQNVQCLQIQRIRAIVVLAHQSMQIVTSAYLQDTLPLVLLSFRLLHR